MLTDPQRLQQCADRIGHRFGNVELLRSALTHRSAGAGHNERLEFLGDAVLNLFITQELYDRFPDSDEGRLTRRRAALVRRETLAQIARRLDLGEFLRLGGGELKSGGGRRASILADALEAVAKDPKTRLQEYLQARRLPLPVYHLKATEGGAHQQWFIVECETSALPGTWQGRGGSRRAAEQAAAELVLTRLGA